MSPKFEHISHQRNDTFGVQHNQQFPGVTTTRRQKGRADRRWSFHDVDEYVKHLLQQSYTEEVAWRCGRLTVD